MVSHQTSESAYVIDLTNVRKRYGGGVEALRGVDMKVTPGEIFGLLGPNGAGKSTLVKIMMSVVRPTHVEGTILGRPVGSRSMLSRVGYLPENHRFPRYLTGWQVLDYFGALARVPKAIRRHRAKYLLELVKLTGAANRRVSTFSKGMQQRLGLAQAMINDPDLVMLDEPTDGLDPEGRVMVRNVLDKLRADGKTVFINSHLLGEVEQICDCVAILHQGQVVRQGRLSDLTQENAKYAIQLAPEHETQAIVKAVAPLFDLLESADPNNPQRAASALLASGETITVQGNRIEVLTADPLVVQPVIDHLRGAGLVVASVQPMRQTLEQFFFGSIANGREPGAN